MSTSASVERRKFPRVLRKFIVKFRVIGGPAGRDIADRVGQVTNISQSGILLVSKRPLQPGTYIEIKFPENALSGGPRTLQGQVRRTAPETPEGDNPAGVTFVRIPARPEGKDPAPPKAAAPKGSERRTSERQVQKLLLKLRCVSEGLFHELEPRGGLLMNVSQGGMEVWTTRDYAPGCVLEIQVPENAVGAARTVRAKVVWARPAEKQGQYRLGLAT